eukprot:354893-Chlamydomonas_euryale.AAC.8
MGGCCRRAAWQRRQRSIQPRALPPAGLLEPAPPKEMAAANAKPGNNGSSPSDPASSNQRTCLSAYPCQIADHLNLPPSLTYRLCDIAHAFPTCVSHTRPQSVGCAHAARSGLA